MDSQNDRRSQGVTKYPPSPGVRASVNTLLISGGFSFKSFETPDAGP